MKITTAAGAAATLSAALVLAACGSNDTSSAPAPAPLAPAASSAAAAPSGQHNDADIAFVQGMIPHHAQAVQMSQMAADHADNEQVMQLATRIEQAQGLEIAQMRGFLKAWGAPESGGMPGMGAGGMDHDATGQPGQQGMGGMMSEQQMQQLGQSDDAAFDGMFLRMMIQHHEGAIAMARTELTNGSNPDAKALAQRIIDAQQAEIAEMKQLLGG
jgi:uncharacterized protein (DUF305 family)